MVRVVNALDIIIIIITSFGSGQGGGASGFHWTINQDIINKVLETDETQACVIRHPITGGVRTNNGIVFADDLTQISISSLEHRSNTTNISTLQKSVQLANNCLRSSGGSFSIQKCSFRHLDIDRKWTLRDVPNSQFTIQPTPTSDHQIFTLFDKTKPQKVLGVHTVPTNSTTYQWGILLQRSQAIVDWSTQTQCYYPTYTASIQYIHPSIGFPLVPQRLTQKQIDLIQSPTLCTLLRRLHKINKC